MSPHGELLQDPGYPGQVTLHGRQVPQRGQRSGITDYGKRARAGAQQATVPDGSRSHDRRAQAR